MNRWKRILHATDLSSASRPAFRRAVQLGRGPGAELIVVHVVFTISAYEVSVIGSPAFCEAYEAPPGARASGPSPRWSRARGGAGSGPEASWFRGSLDERFRDGRLRCGWTSS